MTAALTDEQRATMPPYVARWVRRDLTGGRLDRRDRDRIVAGLRRCYAAADLPWPGTVVWASSPRIGEAAAQTAAATLLAVREAASTTARDVARARFRRRLRWARSVLVTILVAALVVGGLGGYLVAFVEHLIRPTSNFLTWWWRAGLGWAVPGVAFGLGCCEGLWDSLTRYDEGAAEVRRLTAGAAGINATGARIRAATVGGPLGPAVARAVRDGIQRPVAAATEPVWSAVLPDRWPQPTADERLRIRRVARAALRWTGPDPFPTTRDLPGRSLVAQHADATVAGLLWWHRYGGGVPDGDRWAGLQAYAEAGRVWWWAHPDFVVVSKPPLELHVERDQVHRADGPAVRWRDGSSFHFWRGVHVPADLIDDGWDVATIHEHPNSEVRRAAIERMGWLDYLERAGLRLVATAPDPGNAPHDLLLYADPADRLGGARVLVMTNGSPDRTGRLRRYAETVPGRFDDPVAAAAWQYDCPVDTYRRLRRRT